MTRVIDIKDATVYRGDTRVFEDLNLQIESGQSTAILGPNGAGKTTLLKLLSCELYPVVRKGSYVRVLGRDRWNVWDLRNQLGIISNDLQNEYLGYVSGTEVILSGFYSSIGTYQHQSFSREQQTRACKTLHALGIFDLRDKPFAAMSTGQQRRFLLGRALVNEPEHLVLDEPTSGLDLKATFQYLEIVRGLLRSGHTVVLVTHHVHEIPPEIQHVVLMDEGKVVSQGAKGEILNDASLSALFDTPIRLVDANGYYQVLPG
jgi:iron complex transport system ATP-binding protein